MLERLALSQGCHASQAAWASPGMWALGPLRERPCLPGSGREGPDVSGVLRMWLGEGCRAFAAMGVGDARWFVADIGEVRRDECGSAAQFVILGGPAIYRRFQTKSRVGCTVSR